MAKKTNASDLNRKSKFIILVIKRYSSSDITTAGLLYLIFLSREVEV